MKKRLILFFICGVIAINSALAITPMELKEGRAKVYEWILKYNNNMDFRSRRHPERLFIRLFENPSTKIYNDYYPDSTYNYSDPYVTVREYVDMRINAPYKTLSSELSDIQLLSESRLSNNRIEYIIEFRKQISYEYKKDSSYVYPQIEKIFNVTLVYDFQTKNIFATKYRLSHKEKKLQPFYILHEDNKEKNNVILRGSELNILCQEKSDMPMIKYSYTNYPFDKKIVHYVSDTTKNSVGVRVGAGVGQYNFEQTGFSEISKINYDAIIGFNYYRQIYLKGKNRFGINLGLQYKWTKYNFSGKYYDQYDTIDRDGGDYLRKISLPNFCERINNHTIGIPINFRYDYFLNKKMSVFAKIGVGFNFKLSNISRVTGEVEYSGYYDWLYDVEINQNGIYDFGTFKIDQDLVNNKFDFNLELLTEVGWTYYFNPKFSLDLSLNYTPMIYNTHKSEDFHLTKYNGDLHSSYSSFNRLKNNIVNFNIQFNYNF